MKKNKTGFTFIELMLAVSIFAIVAVVIYSTFNTGISAWKKAEVAQNLYQDIRLTLDKMAEDLENAVKYSEKENFSNFEANQNSISFYSLEEVFTGLPKVPAHPELRKISYSLSGSMLQRLDETIPELLQEKPVAQPEEMSAKISELNFSYYYIDKTTSPASYKWDNVWDWPLDIPRGVKIGLKVVGEEKSFVKYVFIPSGVEKQKND